MVHIDKNTIESNFEPLYEGWRYKDKLEYNQSRIYRHAKWSKNKTNVYIISRGGVFNAYQGQCISFPNCTNYLNYNKKTQLIYAFSRFISSIEPDNENDYKIQNVHIVECKDKQGCFIDIYYNDQSLPIKLERNKNYAKFIGNNEKEIYYIDETKMEDKSGTFEINLDVLTGDVELKFIPNIKYQSIFFGSSEKYIIESKEIKGKNITIEINTANVSYYVISYRFVEKNKNYVEIGESGLLLQYVSESEKENPKYFTFWHNNPENNINPYVINIIPLNCNLSVTSNNTENNRTINKNKFGFYEDILHDKNEKKEFKIHKLSYIIKMNNFIGNSPKDKRCYFYIGASESSIELPTLLREDLPYTRTLSEHVLSASFVWPFAGIKEDTIIKINLQNSISIKPTIKINDKKISNVIESFSRSTLIQLKKEDFKHCENGCPISLTLTIDKKRVSNITVPVEVILSTGRNTPQILPKGVFRRCGFNDNSTNYYFIPLAENDEGEVILDFRRGTGIMFAEFYKGELKKLNDKKAWRGKIILPTEEKKEEKKNLNNSLEYNLATQKIYYKSSLTKNCNSCILIVGVTNKITSKSKDSIFTSEYNIIVKDSKNKGSFDDNAINVPINEFIIGSIEMKKQYNDSYIVDILDNYKGLEIEFKSETTILYLSFNNNNPNNENCVIYPTKEISIYNFPNTFCKIAPESWNNVRLKIQVSLYKGLYDIKNNSSLYYFRVRPIYDKDKNIIEINSDKETIYNGKKGTSYFMLPLSSWDGNSDFIFYVDSNNIEQYNFNKINSKEYDKCDDINCWSTYFSPDESYNNVNKSNYFIIPKRNFSKSDYLLVKIKSNNKEDVRIISSIKNDFYKTLSKPNYPQIIYVYKNEPKIVEVNKYVTQINVTLITGKGYVADSKKNHTINETKSTIIQTEGLRRDVEIRKNNETNNFLILLKYNYTTTPKNISNDEITENIKKITIADKSGKSFYYNFTVKHKKNYSIFKTKNEGKLDLGPIHIFMNEKKIESLDNYTKGNYLYHDNLMVIKNNKNNNKTTRLYITIVCPYKCEGILEFYGADYIDSDGNTHFEFMDKGIYIFKMNKKEIFKNSNDSSIQITLFNPQIKAKKEYLKITNDTNKTDFIKNISKGLLINDMELSYIIHNNDTIGENIYISITGEDNKLMRFTSRIINKTIYRVNDPAIYILKSNKNDFSKEECINIIGYSNQNYNLRIITVEPIIVKINNKSLYLSNHSDYSTFITINDTNNIICFKANEELKATKMALSFQIIYHEKYSYLSVLEPLYEGWEYKENIKHGQTRIFRQANPTLNLTNLYILVNNGYVEVEEAKCIKFPYCDKSNVENKKKLMYGFSSYTSLIKGEVKSPPSHQMIHIIKCSSININCDITIKYSDKKNNTQLYSSQTHAKFIQQKGFDDYVFKPINEKFNYSSVELNLDIISGNAFINIKGQLKYNHISFGLSEKFYFDKKDVFNKSISFSVNAISNTYYAVSFRYQIDNNKTNVIKENGLVLQSIKPNQTIQFQFVHNNADKSDKNRIYIINVIPINCKLEIYNSENTKNKLEINSLGYLEESFLSKNLNYTNNLKNYTAKLKGITHAKNQNKSCYFYAGGSESSENIPTLLRENVPYLRTFNAENYKGVFNLPFPYVKGNLYIKINKFNSYLMEYSIKVNEGKEISRQFHDSIIITITEEQLKVCNNTINGCVITITIKLKLNDIKNNEKPEFPIEIIALSGRKQPLVLPKGILKRTIINNNITDYYYMEIENDEEGEIILDFKKGSGLMFAKIIEKAKNKNWRNDIMITKNNANLLYDRKTQRIKYKNNIKSSDGSILIIGVESKDNYTQGSLLTTEYTIFARYIISQKNITNITNISQFGVNIPVNEYIIGSLSNRNSETLMDSYFYKITDNNIDSFEFEFKSQNAKLYYNISNIDDIFVINNSKGIESKNHLVKNESEKIQKNMEGSLRLIVKLDKISNNSEQYLFRINPIYYKNNNPIKLIEISNDKPVLCNYKEGQTCYYYLPIKSYDNNKEKLILYANQNQNQNTSSKICVNFHNIKEINKERSYEKWPTKNQCNSQTKNDDKFLTIDLKKTSSSNIILISLFNEVNSSTTLYSAFISQTKSISPNPNSLHLVYLEKINKTQNIDTSDFQNALKHINIIKIKGNGTITCDKNSTVIQPTNQIKCNKNLNITSKSDILFLTIEYILNDTIPNSNESKDNKSNKDQRKNKGNNNKLIIIILVVALVLIIAIATILIFRNKNNKDNFNNNVAQLSLTLNAGRINSSINNPQRQPLIDKTDD